MGINMAASPTSQSLYNETRERDIHVLCAPRRSTTAPVTGSIHSMSAVRPRRSICLVRTSSNEFEELTRGEYHAAADGGDK